MKALFDVLQLMLMQQSLYVLENVVGITHMGRSDHQVSRFVLIVVDSLPFARHPSEAAVEHAAASAVPAASNTTTWTERQPALAVVGAAAP